MQGQCVVEDLRESAFTACKVDANCELRNGTSCCESCTSENLVAVTKPLVGADAYFGIENLVCGDVRPPCLACVPGKPADAIATCGPTGHCVVSQLLAGTDNTP